MTKHTDGPNVSDFRNDVLADQSRLISAGPSDLVVLRALGKHTRMAKTIRRTTDGLVVEPHDGRKVYLVAHARTLSLSDILEAGRGLAVVADDEFVVRGAIHASANPRRMRRLLHARPDLSATMAEVPRRYVLFDIDGSGVPIAFDPRNQVIEEEGPPDDPGSLAQLAQIEGALRPKQGLSEKVATTFLTGFRRSRREPAVPARRGACVWAAPDQGDRAARPERHRAG